MEKQNLFSNITIPTLLRLFDEQVSALLIVFSIHLILNVLNGLDCLSRIVYLLGRDAQGRGLQDHLVELAGGCVEVRHIGFIKIMVFIRVEGEDPTLRGPEKAQIGPFKKIN